MPCGVALFRPPTPDTRHPVLLRFSMERVAAAAFARTVFLQLHPVRMLDPVLRRRVVTRTTLRTGHRDYNAGLFLSHRSIPPNGTRLSAEPLQHSITQQGEG